MLSGRMLPNVSAKAPRVRLGLSACHGVRVRLDVARPQRADRNHKQPQALAAEYGPSRDLPLSWHSTKTGRAISLSFISAVFQNFGAQSKVRAGKKGPGADVLRASSVVSRDGTKKVGRRPGRFLVFEGEIWTQRSKFTRSPHHILETLR